VRARRACASLAVGRQPYAYCRQPASRSRPRHHTIPYHTIPTHHNPTAPFTPTLEFPTPPNQAVTAATAFSAPFPSAAPTHTIRQHTVRSGTTPARCQRPPPPPPPLVPARPRPRPAPCPSSAGPPPPSGRVPRFRPLGAGGPFVRAVVAPARVLLCCVLWRGCRLAWLDRGSWLDWWVRAGWYCTVRGGDGVRITGAGEGHGGGWLAVFVSSAEMGWSGGLEFFLITSMDFIWRL
jgi:hypothetical protein